MLIHCPDKANEYMIISTLIIIVVILCHVLPKKTREKVLYRLKRFLAKIRQAIKANSASKCL